MSLLRITRTSWSCLKKLSRLWLIAISVYRTGWSDPALPSGSLRNGPSRAFRFGSWGPRIAKFRKYEVGDGESWCLSRTVYSHDGRDANKPGIGTGELSFLAC